MSYLYWIIIMAAFVIIEIATVNLVTIWFAFGALLACIVSLTHLNIYFQIGAFAFGSVLLLIFTKPIVKNKLSVKKINTNADRVIGKEAVVTDDITSGKFAGKVIISGQEWSAISEDGCDILKGSTVFVKKIQGVRLVVDKVKETADN